MWFVRTVFLIAGIYGVVVILPQYFMEKRIGQDFPPPVTHPEHFYGFVGVALAWQVALLIIASDPIRYRPIMLLAVLEKATFGVAVTILYGQGRTPGLIFSFGLIDLLLGMLFLAAWRSTGQIEAKTLE
jgi:hypothetical protein